MFKLSVITVNYNDKTGLSKTITSVLSQTNQNFEFIIIDGNSNDGSVDLLKLQSANRVNWVSENDDGVYDAQNKGIGKSNGEYLLFLNSGDSFYSNNVVETFLKMLEASSAQIIYGNSNLLLVDNVSEILTPPHVLDNQFWYRGTLNHQAVFIKKSLFDHYGIYETRYKVCADFNFFLKCFVNNAAIFQHFDCVVCNYDQTGTGVSRENFDAMMIERQEVLHKYLSEAQLDVMRKKYQESLSLKHRILNEVTERPLLNAAFKRIYATYSKLKGKSD